jgi:uncharacterized protein RhaS with RHS repeats
MQSQVRNRAAGEHYNYFRDYDPAIGRYIESDPVGVSSYSAIRFLRSKRFNRSVVGAMISDARSYWGARDTYSYVGSMPLRAIDPMGLWSFSFEGYDGVGGGIVFGQNSDGKWFVSLRVGGGFGGGFSYDPNGSGAAADSCNCKWNAAFGLYNSNQAGLGPFFIGNSVGGGMILNPGCGGPTLYSDANPLSWGLDAGLRFRLQSAAGLEVTLY